MAKKGGGVTPQFIPRSQVMTHINSQTFGADSSVELGEKIETPGWSEILSADSKFGRGIMLLEVFTCMDPTLNLSTDGWLGINTETFLMSQVQLGDTTAIDSGVPVALALSDYRLLYHRADFRSISTDGGAVHIEPRDLKAVRNPPIIVTPSFTVVHKAQNDACWQSNTIHTSLTYQIVDIPLSVYTVLFQAQTRVS